MEDLVECGSLSEIGASYRVAAERLNVPGFVRVVEAAVLHGLDCGQLRMSDAAEALRGQHPRMDALLEHWREPPFFLGGVISGCAALYMITRSGGVRVVINRTLDALRDHRRFGFMAEWMAAADCGEVAEVVAANAGRTELYAMCSSRQSIADYPRGVYEYDDVYGTKCPLCDEERLWALPGPFERAALTYSERCRFPALADIDMVVGMYNPGPLGAPPFPMCSEQNDSDTVLVYARTTAMGAAFGRMDMPVHP
jgi:hypothetical protein